MELVGRLPFRELTPPGFVAMSEKNVATPVGIKSWPNVFADWSTATDIHDVIEAETETPDLGGAVADTDDQPRLRYRSGCRGEPCQAQVMGLRPL